MIQTPKIPLLSTLAITALLATHASADVIVSWDFDGLTNPGATNYTSTNGADATYATPLAMVSVGTIDAGRDEKYKRRLEWSTGNAASNELNLVNWDLKGAAGGMGDTGGVGDRVPNNWIQFSLAADPGFVMNLDSITMSAWRNSGINTPEYFAWDSSIDGGSSWQDFGAVYTETMSGIPASGPPEFQESTYTGSLTAQSVLLRFAPTGGTGNLHIESFSVNGTVAAVPEPSSLCLLGIVGVVGFVRRHRLQRGREVNCDSKIA